MKREQAAPIPNFGSIDFRNVEGGENMYVPEYWGGDACYRFSPAQIQTLRDSTQRLHDDCMAVMDTVIKSGAYYDRLQIPRKLVPYIESAWQHQHRSLFGRMDLAYDGVNPPKLLEYNSESAGDFYVSSVLQREWLKAQKKPDQFNDIHQNLVRAWEDIGQAYSSIKTMHFAGNYACVEDAADVEYVRLAAEQAGIGTRAINLPDIGWNKRTKSFVDEDGNAIQCMFKLYPWEFMAQDEFIEQALRNDTGFIEPVYQMILRGKGILPVLWEKYPDHENLLPASFTTPTDGSSYVRKPIWGLQGQNISIITPEFQEVSEGNSGAEGFVYQSYAKLPEFDGKFPVVGSWVVGGKASGVTVFEDSSRINQSTYKIQPHYVA
jgi:glutathionylspermidine synthase